MPFEYSPEQQEAIDYSAGHLQIVACAGSGKTEVVSRRIVRLLREGSGPEEIVAFTFTEKAAGELKARIMRHVKEELPGTSTGILVGMFVGTIHSYCLGLLQDHVPELAAYDIIDPHRLNGLVSREWDRLALDQLAVQGRWATVQAFLDSVSVVDNELLQPADFEGTAFHECYLRFEEVLRDYRVLTFGRLICRAVEELQSGSLVDAVQNEVRHVIVDEYQDTNPAQEELISLLAAAGATVCVVGDDDQSIYQWRGALVDNIITFGQRYQGSHQVSIPKNYRARPQIISAANRISRAIQPRIAKSMLEHRPGSGDEVIGWTAETPEDEAALVADTIEDLVGLGYRSRDIALLLRSVRTSSRPFIEEFERRGIPYRCAGRTGLFLQPEAQALGMMYAWLVDATWKSSRFDDDVSVTLDSLVETFREAFGVGSDREVQLRSLLRSMYQEVRDADVVGDLIRDYYLVLRVLGVHEWDADERGVLAQLGLLAQVSKLLADYEGFMRRGWRDAASGSRFRSGHDRGEWYYWHLYTFIQYYALEAYEDYEGAERLEHDVVQVMTVHQAKGLEWPVVFIPCLSGQRFPSSRTGTAKQWLVPRGLFQVERYEGTLDDERRLFYVALTRARDQTYLSTFARINRPVPPSPFLVDALAGEQPDARAPVLPPTPSETTRGEEDPLLMSFSELAQYEFCPANFRYRVLLGFEPRLVQELGYGRAIHHMLRRIGEHARDHGQLPGAEELNAVFQGEFQLPYATRFGFDAMEEAARGLVDSYLGEYGSELTGAVRFEKRLELDLEVATVTGRADVVLRGAENRDSGLEIVDYKLSVDDDVEQQYGLQMATYAAAARQEGLELDRASVHDLSAGRRTQCPTDEDSLKETVAHLGELCSAIAAGDYPHRPGDHCGKCDVRVLCIHGAERW